MASSGAERCSWVQRIKNSVFTISADCSHHSFSACTKKEMGSRLGLVRDEIGRAAKAARLLAYTDQRCGENSGADVWANHARVSDAARGHVSETGWKAKSPRKLRAELRLTIEFLM